MRKTLISAALATILLWSPRAEAQSACENGTCVAKEDLKAFLELAKAQKCLKETKPSFDLDPVTITIDKDGRVFYTGSEPKPYTLRMKWCSYDVEAKGKVNLVAAMREPPEWEFRFRLKAYTSLLLAEPFYPTLTEKKTEFADLTDIGVMVDFFHYKWLNINVALGYRSVGGGLGFDLTRNFGVYAGYGLTWGTWHHNPNVGLYFSFW